MERKKKFTCAW